MLVDGFTLEDWSRLSLSECYCAGAVDRQLWLNPANRGALASWREAQSDHAHTSFYGVGHIRRMRAYWLGVARAARASA